MLWNIGSVIYHPIAKVIHPNVVKSIYSLRFEAMTSKHEEIYVAMEYLRTGYIAWTLLWFLRVILGSKVVALPSDYPN